MDDRALDGAVTAWFTAEAARAAAVSFARDVASPDTELMAIKGVHLAWCFGAKPWRRAMSDVDLVVVRGDFGAVARRAVSTGRWRVRSDNWSTKTLEPVAAPGAVSCVDLHRLPLPPLFGRLHRSRLLARARSGAPTLEGLLVPDPLDAAAFVLAHFVKDGVQSPSARDDFAFLAREGSFDAPSLAARLEEHGLRRIGIVGLAALGARDPGLRRWLDALEPTPSELALARAAAKYVPRWAARSSPIALACVRPFQDDAMRVIGSTAFGGARLVRDALRSLGRAMRGR